MTKKIIGLGNALADILYRMDNEVLLDELGFGRGSMHLVGEDIHELIENRTSGMPFKIVSGGSAANTIRGLSRMGIPSAFIGKTGNDNPGRYIQNEMIRLGTEPKLIPGTLPTGRCMVLISPDGERTMATYLGSAVTLRPEEIETELFTGFDILHVEGYLVQDHNLIESAVKRAKDAGLMISLDMASYNVVKENRKFLRELSFNYVDLLFANEEEAETLTGKKPEEAVIELGNLTRTAVVKIGAEGSLIVHDNGPVIRIEAIPARVIDTTGAGDLYASGFLFGLSRDATPEQCGRIGSLVAAKAIAYIGTAIPSEGWTEIFNEIGYSPDAIKNIPEK